MNKLPFELVNKIIMFTRPTYFYMSELEEHIKDWKEDDDDDYFCEYVFIAFYLSPVKFLLEIQF